MKKGRGKIVPVREPSGRLSRATERAIDAVPPAVVRRLRDAAASRMVDAEWGTELGRLFLSGKLTASQYEAGKRWGRLVMRYRAAIGAPAPYAGEGPIAYLGTVRSKSAGDDPPIGTGAGDAIRAERVRIIAEMHEAHGVVLGAGKLAEAAVRSLCEENEVAVDYLGLTKAQDGLNWLALHWGVDKD